MRILVVSAGIQKHETLGASHIDSLTNMKDLVRLGHTVRVLTYAGSAYQLGEVSQFYARYDIDSNVLPARYPKFSVQRLFDLAYLDGAAWQFGHPALIHALRGDIQSWRPELIWCDMSPTWPAVVEAQRHGIPSVARPINFEPKHFLEQHSHTAVNRVKYYGKLFGERRLMKYATVIAAISPVESALYRSEGATCVRLLPLKALPALLRPAHRVRQVKPLNVFFMGANLKVPHNAAALDFIVTKVIPLVRLQAPDLFQFHVLGTNVPDRFREEQWPDITFAGYVPDLDEYLRSMDIALMPTIFGMGMQQKMFEALCRGFPVITTPRALVGYPYQDESELLLASREDSMAKQLLRLSDSRLREKLGSKAAERSKQLFSTTSVDRHTQRIIQTAAARHP